MGWAMLYLFLALKIPLCAAIWLVWWAIRQEPDPSEDVRDDGGNARQRPHPVPRRPRTPRRGPHRRARPARRGGAGPPAGRPHRGPAPGPPRGLLGGQKHEHDRRDHHHAEDAGGGDRLPLAAPEVGLRAVARVAPLGRLAHPVVVVRHPDSIPGPRSLAHLAPCPAPD